ncbi:MULTISPECIES: helix-turn-helix transcriptional regulator [Eggerthellaceae]|jgi:DNA-binding CsgD family transcriptional regulator|nr:LuxR family transcriptional regulator [Eggerthella lenta]MDB1797467.1 LuxR family transcriptional regulator [Eggerthella lenta]MDB1803113.1 LuxR family transcriptional regulator [Eggerthella lenta]MDN4468585.1 LuxR family transcriptional regulator [Eggerthella lenta]RDC25600.1 hypothetical protein C1855_14360 [Eggerthella lenta]RDC29009.1 hypothetical protein C1854_14340 [Eggerthella lenta]
MQQGEVLNRRMGIVAVVGMAFYWPMLRRGHMLLYFPNAAYTGLPAETYYMVTVVIAAMLALAAIPIRSAVGTVLRKHAGLVVPFCFAPAAVYAVTLIFSSGEASQPLAVLETICLALAFFIVTVSWGLVYASLPSRRSCFYLACSFLGSFVLTSLESSFFAISTFVPLFWLPFTAISLYFLVSWKKVAAPNNSDSAEQQPRFADYEMIVILIVFLLVGSFMRGTIYSEVLYEGEHSATINALSLVLSVVAVIGAVAVKREKTYLYLFWAVLAILYFAGLFWLAIFKPDAYWIGGVLLTIGRTFFAFVLFALFAWDSYGLSSSRVVASFLAFLLVEAVSAVSTYVVVPGLLPMFRNILGDPFLVFSLVAALVMIIASFAYFARISVRQSSGVKSEDVADLLLTTVADRYHLTDRESEILMLLYRGNTYKKIGELMFISPNTVLSHTKSIYRKMEVHSKQELIDLVNSYST